MKPTTPDPIQNSPAPLASTGISAYGAAPCDHATRTRIDDALTLDGLSLSVDGIVYWHAAIDARFQDRQTADHAARACLRTAVGRSTLVELLVEQPAVEERLHPDLERAAADGTPSICAISIAHVRIPASLKADFDARLLESIEACRKRHFGSGDPLRTGMPPLVPGRGLPPDETSGGRTPLLSAGRRRTL
jgi:hypothetical protein